jgi:ribosomal protein S18 acetylase RimI-like enzyme
MNILVRLVNISDAKNLYLLNKEFNGDHIATEEDITVSLLNTKEIVMAALYNEDMLGFICGNISRSMCHKTAHGEIGELFVSERYRKLGIGRKLIEAMELYFKQNDISIVTLYTSNNNLIAQQFYKRCGYNEKQRIEYRRNI